MTRENAHRIRNCKMEHSNRLGKESVNENLEKSLVGKRSGTKMASKGCWTCKSRKIGCDKTLPSCNNCVCTLRTCEGYGLKLHWPEAVDGRRPLNSWDFYPVQDAKPRKRTVNGQVYFLNTTNDDLSCHMINPWIIARNPGPGIPGPSNLRSLNFGFEASSNGNDKMLMGYYNEVLSRMITTIDDSRNGFRTVLLPSALSVQSLASQSLREAILSLSAFHLWGPQAAIKHKISSIRLLSQSIQANESQLISQFGTCMMLCVCDVFDAVDGSWYSHMRAANTLSDLIRAHHSPDDPTVYFLTTWLAYHKVLSEFSHIPKQLDSKRIYPQLPHEDARNQVIIGSLGCSMEVLECISCTNQLAAIIEQNEIVALLPEFASIVSHLEAQLETLQQIPHIVMESKKTTVDEARISHTAELYRIAALIYLYSSVIRKSVGSPKLKLVVEMALSVLTKLGICTSPWPLFIIACEVTGDEQRVMILNTLEKMQKERRIGNVEIMRNIIEAVWKRTDLNASVNEKTRVNWKELVDTTKQLPSFI